MPGRSPGQHMPLQQALPAPDTGTPLKEKNNIVIACLTTPEHVKESPPSSFRNFPARCQPWRKIPLVPSLLKPESPAPAGWSPPPPQLLSVRPNNAHHQPKLLVQPLLRRHACLAGPPANTCSRNSHQNKPQKNPPSSFRNLRRKADLPSHRSSGRILHTLSRGAAVALARCTRRPRPSDPPRGVRRWCVVEFSRYSWTLSGGEKNRSNNNEQKKWRQLRSGVPNKC